MIAEHRGSRFGRTRDSGTCTLRTEPVFRHSAKFWPVCFSLLILVLVTLPVKQNFRSDGKATDDFPLSWYPMFSSKRQNLYQQAFVAAIRPDGELVSVRYRILGPGGLNQNRRQLARLLSARKAEELRRYLSQVADRLVAAESPRYRGCMSVAAVRATYDLDGYFTRQRQQPVHMELILETGLPVSRDRPADIGHSGN